MVERLIVLLMVVLLVNGIMQAMAQNPADHGFYCENCNTLYMMDAENNVISQEEGVQQ